MIFGDREHNFYMDRNFWLEAKDISKQSFCLLENFQSTGKGGQKRNKTRSAVRLTHIPTKISVTADNYREQNLNRQNAERKLRVKLAMQLSGSKIDLCRSVISLESFQYPLFVAFLLDSLYVNNYEISQIAENLSISNSKLLKLIFRDRLLWDGINEMRAILGKHNFILYT